MTACRRDAHRWVASLASQRDSVLTLQQRQRQRLLPSVPTQSPRLVRNSCPLHSIYLIKYGTAVNGGAQDSEIARDQKHSQVASLGLDSEMRSKAQRLQDGFSNYLLELYTVRIPISNVGVASATDRGGLSRSSTILGCLRSEMSQQYSPPHTDREDKPKRQLTAYNTYPAP